MFTPAEIRMLRHAMRIALEDGGLIAENGDGSPNKASMAMADRICARLDAAMHPHVQPRPQFVVHETR